MTDEASMNSQYYYLNTPIFLIYDTIIRILNFDYNIKKIRNVLFYLLKSPFVSLIIITVPTIVFPFYQLTLSLKKKVCEVSFNKVH